MIMDAQNRPSHNQSVAAAAGTIVSEDSIDLLTSLDSPGRSGHLRAVAVLTTALASGGAATIKAELISSEASNLASGVTVLDTGPTIAVADAAAGTKLLDVPLPDTDDRYLGFRYTIGTATTTAGTVTAGIVGGTDRPATNIPMNTGL